MISDESRKIREVALKGARGDENHARMGGDGSSDTDAVLARAEQYRKFLEGDDLS